MSVFYLNKCTHLIYRISNIDISNELKKSFHDYAMNVIADRAIPDIRDGLKTVHRRILFAMYKEGLFFNNKYSKCAGVVGEVLKKYHPHGDMSVYEALVRMAQPWNMNTVLIDGQGNFGSIDGDKAAAYRYTESRLSDISSEFIKDLKEKTIKFIPNFDNTTNEPTILPCRFPNLLINGSEGIAVAMATKCPPHNLSEIISGLLLIINSLYFSNKPNNFITLNEIIPGPDFPTGGSIHSEDKYISVINTGKGSILIRGNLLIEKDKKKITKIIIKSIPYQISKNKLLNSIINLIKHKKINTISDLRDESNRDGMRIVISLKKDTNPQSIIKQLYSLTPLQIKYSINILVLVNKKPQTLSLYQCLHNFIKFRQEIVIKRTQYLLNEAFNKIHIYLGFIVALENIEKLIYIIKCSDNNKFVHNLLLSCSFYNLSYLPIDQKQKIPIIHKWVSQNFISLDQTQISKILDMRLNSLVKLEKDKIYKDILILIQNINKFDKILNSQYQLMLEIKYELNDLLSKYGSSRKSVFF